MAFIGSEYFDKLPEEKRFMILNAAFTCFGKHGYSKTAMSEIAAEANISKAALFHYFGTKKDLYIHIFRFACDKVLEKMEAGTEDYFECLMAGARAKVAIMEKYPSISDFFSSIIKEDTALIVELEKATAAKLSGGMALLFANVKWKRLREGVSAEDVKNLCMWVNEGCIKANVGKKSSGEILEDLSRYFELIKKAVYKESEEIDEGH